MTNPTTDLVALEQRLSVILSDLRASDSVASWQEIEVISRTLANVDSHSILGETALPRTLASLLALALHESSTPDDQYTSVVFELLRVAANLCMDHDENRGRLLETGFPQAIVSLLEGYAESLPPPSHTRVLELSIPHLRVIKTSIGALLNASIGYDPVRFRLISLEAPLTILKLSTAIYSTGYWYSASTNGPRSAVGDEDEWILRSGLSNWAWLTLSELKDVKDDTLPVLTSDFLPLLVQPLSAFLPDASHPRPLFDEGSELLSDLIDADLENLSESCMLIESLALDVDDMRVSLARGLHSPMEHNDIPCLSIILDFIEQASYPISWTYAALDETDRKHKEKTFNICKAALIKAVVEVAGEDRNADILWDDSKSEMPGGDFVHKMVDWLKRYVKDLDTPGSEDSSGTQSVFDREDMVICASLSLGNLARQERKSATLVSPPYSLVPILTSKHLLSPLTDIKVKHGVLGLLKHLAQTAPSSTVIHNALREAEIVRKIVESGVWDEKGDVMADVVQLSAIGVVKHMAGANVEHVYALVLPSAQSPELPTGLNQILSLVKRSDSVPIKSEGSRVLVNIVRALRGSKPFATTSDAAASGSVDRNAQEKQKKHNAALRMVITPESALVLTRLVGASGKYPLLVNEGLVALTMFSMSKEGALLVLDALTAPLGLDLPIDSPLDSLTANDLSVSSPSKSRVHLNTPRHPLDMLMFALKNVDNPANFPSEVRANVCSFFIQLTKLTHGDKLEQVKEAIRPVLESLLGSSAVEERLENALRRLLEAWL
ncbi:hypothetical protein C0992_001244 [Termitomyces sp. T32_za158]|nr:hypothetical protein C0992_001244 [Termitomyces sp. T32_za158]